MLFFPWGPRAGIERCKIALSAKETEHDDEEIGRVRDSLARVWMRLLNTIEEIEGGVDAVEVTS